MIVGRFTIILAVVSAAMLISIGCSGLVGNDRQIPLAPSLTNGDDTGRSASESARHSPLGLYSCAVDPSGPEIRTIPLREAMFHLNALRFLEPPPPLRLKLSNLVISGEKIDVDVQLIHPFPGMDKYTGFDVCGIVITSGSISGFTDPDLVVAGEGDTRLINPDGLSRWWNPREFPYNEKTPLWGYIDGNRGISDSVAHYTATLNGYKYFASGLSQYDELADQDVTMRGAFVAGSANTRHYRIELDGGLTFNYAIDACWLPPVGTPVVVPDSFPPSTNREEPWLIQADVTSNTLYYDPTAGSGGGELGLDVRCYDWFNADANTVRVECPGALSPATTNAAIGGSDVYSTYHVDIANPTLTSNNPLTIWVSAEAAMDYDGLLPGKPTAAYMPPFEVAVSAPPSGEVKLDWGDEGVIDHPERTFYNDIDPALIINGAGNLLCSFFWWTKDSDTSWTNRPRFATSTDFGHTFGTAEVGQWNSHQVGPDMILCWNGKYTLGSNGQAFHSYGAPCGHTLHPTPTFEPYTEAASDNGTPMGHAGEMLYTVDGFPMMFGDQGGQVRMRLGSYPNQGGTGTWPNFEGTEYILVDGVANWLSIARSSAKTSDGICHLMFWNNDSLDYIQMISSADTTGQTWGAPVVVFNGLAEIWDSANDPSIWIDKNDGYHTCFCATEWTGKHHLMYGYSADGKDWNQASCVTVDTFPAELKPNDTHVVVFDAFGETYVFLSYESGGDVWCRYKKSADSTFSEAIKVNVHSQATLPDLYPNGDVGAVFAYQADDGSGQGLTDVFYRLAEFKKD